MPRSCSTCRSTARRACRRPTRLRGLRPRPPRPVLRGPRPPGRRRALAEAHPEETWECSHLGGDRFAGTMVLLPARPLLRLGRRRRPGRGWPTPSSPAASCRGSCAVAARSRTPSRPRSTSPAPPSATTASTLPADGEEAAPRTAGGPPRPPGRGTVSRREASFLVELDEDPFRTLAVDVRRDSVRAGAAVRAARDRLTPRRVGGRVRKARQIGSGWSSTIAFMTRVDSTRRTPGSAESRSSQSRW